MGPKSFVFSQRAEDLHLILAMKNGEIMVYNIDIHRASKNQHWPIDDKYSWIEVRAVTRASHILLVINDARYLKISELDSDGCLYTEPHNQWKDHEGELSCMDICGGYIATGGDDGKILLRKIDKVNKVTNEIFAHPSGIYNISISTSGKYLLSCGNDGSVLMWNIHNKDLVKPRHRHSILSINAIHDMPEIHLDHGCKDYLSEYADKKNSHKTKKAKEIRDQILSDIQQLSKDFQELVAENEKLEESERLQSKDFITNQDDDAAFIKTVKQKVLKTKTGK